MRQAVAAAVDGAADGAADAVRAAGAVGRDPLHAVAAGTSGTAEAVPSACCWYPRRCPAERTARTQKDTIEPKG